MNYDFSAPLDRRGTDCWKWAVGENELPMWIADMDFSAAPEILAALQARLDHGVFGYGQLTDDWYAAYQGWWQRRHGFFIERDWLIFSTGVVASLSSLVRKLTTPNENVLIQTPVYNVFFNSIVNNGCRVLESPLVYDGDAYAIDWADLEEKLADPQTTLMVLCNPHNPVGKLWDSATLARIGELCKQNHVVVISDEIHCDLTAPGRGYVPFASVNEVCRDNSITLIAPTKTFNLAGLQTSAVFAADPVLRHKAWRALNTDEVAEPNSFAVPAAVAAYEHGAAWLDALRAYVWENRAYAEDFARAHIPGLKPVHGEATYLLWWDVGAFTDDSAAFAKELRKKTGLFLNAGASYGEAGRRFVRMNLACPRAYVEDAMERLRRQCKSDG